jgi:hypothetical protein
MVENNCSVSNKNSSLLKTNRATGDAAYIFKID